MPRPKKTAPKPVSPAFGKKGRYVSDASKKPRLQSDLPATSDSVPIAPVQPDLRDDATGKLRTNLKEIVNHQKPIYQHFLNLIRGGVHPAVAAGAIGIPPPLFRRWLARGKEASSGIYFRLWSDISLVVSRTVAEVSEEIRLKHPDKWLAAGPALEVFEESELPIPGFINQGAAAQGDTNIHIQGGPSHALITQALIETLRYGIDPNPKALPEPAADPLTVDALPSPSKQ
jgi:hypothetical protein